MATLVDRRIGFATLFSFLILVAALISVTQSHAASWSGGPYKEWLRQVAVDPGIRNTMNGTLRPATTASAVSHARYARLIDLYDATR